MTISKTPLPSPLENLTWPAGTARPFNRHLRFEAVDGTSIDFDTPPFPAGNHDLLIATAGELFDTDPTDVIELHGVCGYVRKDAHDYCSYVAIQAPARLDDARTLSFGGQMEGFAGVFNRETCNLEVLIFDPNIVGVYLDGRRVNSRKTESTSVEVITLTPELDQYEIDQMTAAKVSEFYAEFMAQVQYDAAGKPQFDEWFFNEALKNSTISFRDVVNVLDSGRAALLAGQNVLAVIEEVKSYYCEQMGSIEDIIVEETDGGVFIITLKNDNRFKSANSLVASPEEVLEAVKDSTPSLADTIDALDTVGFVDLLGQNLRQLIEEVSDHYRPMLDEGLVGTLQTDVAHDYSRVQISLRDDRRDPRVLKAGRALTAVLRQVKYFDDGKPKTMLLHGVTQKAPQDDYIVLEDSLGTAWGVMLRFDDKQLFNTSESANEETKLDLLGSILNVLLHDRGAGLRINTIYTKTTAYRVPAATWETILHNAGVPDAVLIIGAQVEEPDYGEAPEGYSAERYMAHLGLPEIVGKQVALEYVPSDKTNELTTADLAFCLTFTGGGTVFIKLVSTGDEVTVEDLRQVIGWYALELNSYLRTLIGTEARLVLVTDNLQGSHGVQDIEADGATYGPIFL